LAFHHDLLEQADHLLVRERLRPKQASLRRAVSTAYYAVFHLLVADGPRLLAPPQPPGLRTRVGRAFTHGTMRNVCKSFVETDAALARRRPSNAIPDTTRDLLNFPLEAALINVLQIFVDLQEARHQADYDLTKAWSRLEAATHVANARTAFTDWQAIHRSPNATVLIAAILMQNQWGRR
jgi:uncharacterized protein (UPF0332 family)